METNPGMKEKFHYALPFHLPGTGRYSRICKQAAPLERTRACPSEIKPGVGESDQLKNILCWIPSLTNSAPPCVIKASVSSLRSGAAGLNPWGSTGFTIGNRRRNNHWIHGWPKMRYVPHWAGAFTVSTSLRNSTLKLSGNPSKMNPNWLVTYPVGFFSEPLALVSNSYTLIERFINLLSNSAKMPTGRKLDYRFQEITFPRPELTTAHLSEEHLDADLLIHRLPDSDRITGTGLGVPSAKGIIEHMA